jgi:2-methylcitrate dehydratase PrpD
MHDPYAEGPTARNFTAGFSAQAGVTAALTAMAGVEGSEAAIETVYDPFEEMLPEGFTSQYEQSPMVTADNTLTLLKNETGIG